MVRDWVIAAALACVPAVLAATPMTVRVTDTGGRPVRDAVVTLYPAGNAGRHVPPNEHFVVSQQNLQFRPFLTIVPVGANVSFPNRDPTKHHVYSFSPAKKFELKLFAKDESRTVHFDKPGIVALGCNIHDQMSAFIFVSDSPWTSKTNAEGLVSFVDAPDVLTRVVLWHPDLRVPGGKLVQVLAVGQRLAQFRVRLRTAAAAIPADY